ncbi:MAG: DUF5320 domain-containing protein [Thermodesulfobacteriota bacterium]|nr:DUF5320 domain-containing protein [Thermodesulfobacteriota bacterium]
MPRGDRTGPNGAGSRTGRGAGLCNDNPEPGFVSSGGAGGMGGNGGRMGGGGRRSGGTGRGVNRPGSGRSNFAQAGNRYQSAVTDNATDTTGFHQQMQQMQQQLNSITDTIKQFVSGNKS